jgi:hypothetical protein
VECSAPGLSAGTVELRIALISVISVDISSASITVSRPGFFSIVLAPHGPLRIIK